MGAGFFFHENVLNVKLFIHTRSRKNDPKYGKREEAAAVVRTTRILK